MTCNCKQNSGSSENLVPLRMVYKSTLTYTAAQTTAARLKIELPQGAKAYAMNIANAPVYDGDATYAVIAIDTHRSAAQEKSELMAGRGVVLDNQQSHDHALAGDANSVVVDLAAVLKADATDATATVTITIYELGPTQKSCN